MKLVTGFRFWWQHLFRKLTDHLFFSVTFYYYYFSFLFQISIISIKFHFVHFILKRIDYIEIRCCSLAPSIQNTWLKCIFDTFFRANVFSVPTVGYKMFAIQGPPVTHTLLGRWRNRPSFKDGHGTLIII